MTPFEIVIDGTDCGGKTPLVNTLVARLAAEGVSVAVAAPFREVEVYPLWETDPLCASQRINDVMQGIRKEHADREVLVWDRGWPTVFVSTDLPEARNLCLPYPHLTVLLLNTEQTILDKVAKHGLTGEWLLQPETRRRFIDAYHALAAEPESVPMRVYRADLEGRFELEQIAVDVVACFAFQRKA
ncbi:hypothetical protein [Oligosphaera ethanolica]|uniref:Thymidylate kinase n=1 Tax=Oligosphaera ethanolica TaxID=760260 RepID=A0AAE3VHT1_9BACT|nr:hypothetical protein [Oligosphaera ethanolica]MDQ0290558.1 thymidylate kinase [Oligosphaera ethanolica]